MKNIELDPAWRVIREHAVIFNDTSYGDFVSKWSFSYYRQRAINLGFTGLRKVLDVGSGHGHWTCALASLNEEVIGIDIHQHRVQISTELIADLWVDNARTMVGDAMQIPFADGEFDGLFCYGVFMFLNPERALAEFRRVLKPGGKIYICTNGPGWWLMLAMKNAIRNRTLANAGWKAFIHSKTPGTPTSLSCSSLTLKLKNNGFVPEQVAAEGAIVLDGQKHSEVNPVYEPKYFGFDNVIEAVAHRDGVAEVCSSEAPLLQFPMLREIRDVLQSQTYSYLRALQRFKTQDTGELTYATHLSRLSYARACSEKIDRHEFLQATASMATAGIQDPDTRIRALVNLCQKLFYHHFATQPVEAGALIEDPVDVLTLRTARCGTSARFLVDLLEVSGFEAGLIAGACHTTAEVYVEGKWRLLDPNLYPVGTILVDQEGRLLPTENAISTPSLLDILPSYINYHCSHIDAFRASYPHTSAELDKYLRYPILPSVGYFGGEFAGERAGRLSRYRKKKVSNERWTEWKHLELVEELAAPVLPTVQRPEQVRWVELRDNILQWGHASTRQPSEPVVYDIYVSNVSRRWSYSSIPNNCNFEIPGTFRRVEQNQLEVDGLLTGGINYITIIARGASIVDVFHLPSEEFTVNMN